MGKGTIAPSALREKGEPDTGRCPVNTSLGERDVHGGTTPASQQRRVNSDVAANADTRMYRRDCERRRECEVQQALRQKRMGVRRYARAIALAIDAYLGNTLAASNTGPSTHTLFMAGPRAVWTSTVQPAQPPTAQAMYSSNETWQGSS